MGGDRISSLPDDVLVQIISSLNTQGAICTGVLSKRWQCLWRRSPSIRLNEEEFKFALRRGNMLSSHLGGVQVMESVEYKQEVREKFMSAVDVVLGSHIAPVLEVFDITFCAPFVGHQAPINQWISYVTSRKKVTELSIKFPPQTDQALPVGEISFHFCTCGSITFLELSGCSLRSFTCIEGFTSIKTLVVRSCSLSLDLIAGFFKEGPFLESCTIENCNLQADLSITAPRLKVLKVIEPEHEFGKMEISAPSLEYLRIQCWAGDTNVHLHGMQSLTNLALDMHVADRFLRENVAELGRVKKLFLNSSFLCVGDALAPTDQNALLVNQLAFLEHLILVRFYSNYDMHYLASLLVVAPKIQKLTLYRPYKEEDYRGDAYNPINDSFCEGLKNLKHVQVIGVVDDIIHLQLVKCLLKNATRLESMEMKFESRVRPALKKKLLALPRGGTPKIYLS